MVGQDYFKQWCAATSIAYAAGSRLMVASSATTQKWKFCLSTRNDDLLDEITTSSDAENFKPSPDIGQVAPS